MDLDLIFVGGLFLAVFSIPGLVNAYSDRRWPRLAALMLIAGGAMLGHSVREAPEEYTLSNVDDVIVRVVATYF